MWEVQWERLHNPDFKPLEFEGFRKQAGANAFTMSPKKWVDATDAIKDNLIPPELTPSQVAYTYANEADMLDQLDNLYDNKVEMA